jgi:hypothetical protein
MLVKSIFSRIPDSLIGIGEKVLASLIYHREFVMATLPRGHDVFSSIVYTDPSIYERRVICGTSTSIEPTGIPPHITELMFLHKIYSNTENLCTRITDGII